MRKRRGLSWIGLAILLWVVLSQTVFKKEQPHHSNNKKEEQTSFINSSETTKEIKSGALGNRSITNFVEAKKVLGSIHKKNPYTIYCNCSYSGNKIDLKSCGYKIQSDAKRASRLEWEHVVPAEAFGKSFVEWREGSENCVKKGKPFKGRKCAEKNQEFSFIEADLYNLWPEIGELNGLRSNYSMAEIPKGSSVDLQKFGDCKVFIVDRKFEPMDAAKGIVARTYMYMDSVYPGKGIISEKNRDLFSAWDKLYPVTSWECERASIIEKIQRNKNRILEERCARNSLSANR